MEAADSEMYEDKRGRRAKHSILLIEDDASIHELIRLGLGDALDVWHAPTAADALSITQERTPHLVILDYYLPDGDGLDLLKKLRTSLGPKVSLIVLTAASDVDEAAVLRAGADDYIEKPFELDVLKARIERLLETASRQR
jgi:DNA-binding response OmpR family regulator